MNKKVANILIETLEQAGVQRCYGIVGDTMNRIAHALDSSDIEWVHMRHEEAGAFAAGAEAALTGRLTECAGSCGPGILPDWFYAGVLDDALVLTIDRAYSV